MEFAPLTTGILFAWMVVVTLLTLWRCVSAFDTVHV